MTKDEIQAIAEQAALKGGQTAARQVLQGLGVDVENPLEAQKDMAHLRAHRQTCESVQRHGMKVGITVLVTSAAAAVLAIFGFRGGLK